MNLQYLADRSGHTTAVQLQIPIEEWNELKKKYKEFEQEENFVAEEIPDWQIALGKKEMEHIKNGTTELVDWEKAKSQFKL